MMAASLISCFACKIYAMLLAPYLFSEKDVQHVVSSAIRPADLGENLRRDTLRGQNTARHHSRRLSNVVS
jgi:hypothetical protein